MLILLYSLSLYEYKPLASNVFSRTENGSESRRIQKVKEYVGANCERDLTLGEIAGIVGMSPSSFSRFFKTMTGKTLTAYVLDVRLGVAARALVDTTKTISEICYSSGFNNISNFNRIFKRSKGVTPKEFRQMYKKRRAII